MSLAEDTRGLKRICNECGVRFYDLNNRPIICPSCDTEFTGEIKVKSRRRSVADKKAELEQELKTKKAVNDSDDIVDEDDEDEEDDGVEMVSLDDDAVDLNSDDSDDGDQSLMDIDDLDDDDLDDDDLNEDDLTGDIEDLPEDSDEDDDEISGA